MDLEALRRRLAAIEHDRWAAWQGWVHSVCRRLPSGELVIPAALVERWERQIATPYDQLNEAEQLSDMGQVERYWPLIAAVLERAERLDEALNHLLAAADRAASNDLQRRAPVLFADLQRARDRARAVLAPAPEVQGERINLKFVVEIEGENIHSCIYRLVNFNGRRSLITIVNKKQGQQALYLDQVYIGRLLKTSLDGGSWL